GLKDIQKMTEGTKEALNEAKKKRRCAKSSVTRAGNGLDYLFKNERPIPEVEESLANLEDLYKKLVEKHDEYIQLVDGDEEFATEEEWIEDCQQRFMQIRIRTKDYLKVKSQGQFENETNPETGLVSENGQQEHDSIPGSGQGPSHQGEGPSHQGQPPTHEGQPPTHEGQPPTHEGQPPTHQGQPLSHQGQTPSHQGQPPSHQGQPLSHQGQTPSHQGQPPTHQGQPPSHQGQPPSHQGQTPSHQGQPPTHQGQEHNSPSSSEDDFKHAIESRYTKRDAMTYLRACLQGKPLELIKGIGTDYDGAWQYLDSIYGDPRYVSDQVTQHLSKFRPLKEGEDSRFCDLVHLVKRSFNTMKGVGKPHDMDNNHMLSLIEQKMCVEDRKIWARELERNEKPASLQGLIAWMETEMKSRMRATAPLRNPSQGSRYVNQLSGGKPPKCWICDNSTRWVDQCEKFKSMSPEDRLKTVRENHACFSCLKKAGRDHRASNCSRRKQCTRKISGVQCKYYHHILLHPSNPAASVGVASVENNTEAMLPVITVKISGKNNRHKQGNILLDSGAQISLICTSTAKNLDLKGKDVSITIRKVGGEEEVLATKVYQVPITSLESGAKFTVKAVGIPHISDDISNINIGEMAKGIGIPEVKIYRECGPIDMLIGIDHAYMHTGDTKKVGNVVARHSPLEENLPSEERSSVKFLEGESEEKVLGVVWNNSKDAFTFKCKANELSVPSQENSSELKLTKRKILSKVARVFDPIGFAAAFLVRAKIGLQRLWQQGLDWDEELSSE
ncbi:PREDICTED: uncharacterized protein LOC107337338, partial [Paramuricea clavata]